MNSNNKKILIAIIPILLFLLILIPILCTIIANNKKVVISYESADVNQGTISCNEETIKIKKDATGSTASPNQGYSFVNWTKDGIEVSKDASFVPEKVKGKNVAATYIANFEAKKYTVTFVGNYEGSEYSVDTEQTYGTKYKFPDINPERPNYDFVGYFTKQGEHITNESVFNDTTNTTLYAHWDAKKYTVTFVGNYEGSEYSVDTEQTYGLNYVLPTEEPTQELFTFIGWFTDPDDLEGEEITSDSIVELTANTTLYAHWESACVAEGTLITMKDGSKKAVETITIGDEIRTFDHENGEISYSTVCFVWKTLNAYNNIFTLHFENDIDVTVIEEHGFFDGDERKYIFINYENACEYIGHKFYNGDTNTFVKLEGVEKVNHSVNAYALVTANHYNHLANGMLSVCDGIMVYLANMFEYDDDLSFNKTDVMNSINAYGLYDKDEFLAKYHGWSSEEFDDYNLEYLSIVIGKGIMSLEALESINNECIAYNEKLN